MTHKIETVTMALVCALCMLAGCQGHLSTQAKQLLQSSYDRYAAKDDLAVIRQTDAFLAENAGTGRANEAYYLRGMAKKRIGDAGAKEDLQAAASKTKNADMRARAKVALGDMAYDEDDMALAENMYRQALGDIEQGQKPSDHAHYRLGCVLQRQGRWHDADVQFDKVGYLFPDTELARKSALRTHCVVWTIQAGAFADKSRADAVAKGLSSENLPALSHAVVRDGKLMFLVQLGRFATYEQAAAALPRAQSRHTGAFVTPAR